MARTIEYADVTGSEWRLSALPGVVQELGRLGYGVVGRVAQRSGGGSDSQFDGEQRARLREWRARPAATMLAASDAESFVSVDRYGDAPVLRFCSAFVDGSLVETVSIASEGILRPRPGLDPFEVFTFGDAAGRSVDLVKDLPVADVVHRHRDRVRTVSASTTPRRHSDLAEAVDLWNAAARHTLDTSRALRRWRLLIGLCWLLVAALPAVALALVAAGGVGWVLAVLVGLVTAVATLALLVPLIRYTARALARARWWRPAYVGGG